MFTLFIFTKDLRLHDNKALRDALKDEKVILAYFFKKTNKFHDDFLLQCLASLNDILHKNLNVLSISFEKILKTYKISKVVFNEYPEFTENIENLCLKNNVQCVKYSDRLLDKITNKQGKPFRVFNFFFKEAQKKLTNFKYSKLKTKIAEKQNLFAVDEKFCIKTKNVKQLHQKAQQIIGDIKKYDRDDGTGLSSYLNHGVISMSQVFEAAKISGELARQLIWKEYYIQQNNISPILWKLTKKQQNQLRSWQTAKTGIQIIDDGIKQLKTTGKLENRYRMLLASFLIHDLDVHWTHGEAFFKRYLEDYDKQQNIGNWMFMSAYWRLSPEIQANKLGV